MGKALVRKLIDGAWRWVQEEDAADGGSQPWEQAIGSGGTTLDGGTSGDVAAAHQAGDALLDYTNPAAPTVLADGIYAVTAVGLVFADAVGIWRFQALLDGSEIATQSTTGSPIESGGEIGATVIGPLSAGDVIRFTVLNDSEDELNFGLSQAVIVKLS